MEIIWSALFIILGVYYIIRSYLTHKNKTIPQNKGVYHLTPSQQQSLIPSMVYHYAITGILLIIGPFLYKLIGSIIWGIILLYMFISGIHISKKRQAFHQENLNISAQNKRTH